MCVCVFAQNWDSELWMSYSYLSYKFVTSVNMYSFVYFFDAAIQPSSCVQLKRLPEEIANNECGDDEMCR